MSLLVLILWIVFSIAVAKRAKSYNRSFWGWFWVSLFFSPLVGCLLVFILPPLPAPVQRRVEPVTPQMEARWAKTAKKEAIIGTTIACIAIAPLLIMMVAALFVPKDASQIQNVDLTAANASPEPSTPKLKFAGDITFNRRVVGCVDINTTLDRQRAMSIAIEADRFLASKRALTAPREETDEITQCQFFTPGRTWVEWSVPNASLPMLPPGTLVACATSEFITSTPEECFWIVFGPNDMKSRSRA